MDEWVERIVLFPFCHNRTLQKSTRWAFKHYSFGGYKKDPSIVTFLTNKVMIQSMDERIQEGFYD